jgi:hypothetical protein
MNAVDEAFADQPEVGPVEGCTRCYLQPELDLLGGDPRLVPDDLVGGFAEEVQDHWTSQQYGPLWRRLAPRIIRLLVVQQPGVDAGLLLRGLGPYGAGFTDWPAQQKSAILDVLGAVLDVALIDGRPPEAVLDRLGAVSHIGHDVTPWTRRLDTLTGPHAEAGLVRLACRWAVDLLWDDEPSWWWYPDDPAAIGVAWLSSRPVRGRITGFAAVHPGCKTATDALAAIERLADAAVSPWSYPTYGYDRARNSGLRHLLHLIPGMPWP